MSQPITEAITVHGSLSDVYRLWADFTNFPIFMKDVASVTEVGDGLTHWVLQGPLGAKFEWDAETTRLEADQRIAWNSKDNSSLKTSGQVTFKVVGPNQTEVTVRLVYAAPGGATGKALARLLANPQERLRQDLQAFKEHIETTATRLHIGAGSSLN
jgi:uncharacterized membrane protein